MIIFKIYFHLLAFFKKILLRIIYGKKISFGRTTTFRRRFDVAIEGNGEIIIGDRCFFNNGCSISGKGKITIGNDSIFGENVKFYDHNHCFSGSGPIKQQGYSVGEIQIGNCCWVGSNVTFLKGAKVGDHCVIGTGCVIDGEVPKQTLVTASRRFVFTPIVREEMELS